MSLVGMVYFVKCQESLHEINIKREINFWRRIGNIYFHLINNISEDQLQSKENYLRRYNGKRMSAIMILYNELITN